VQRGRLASRLRDRAGPAVAGRQADRRDARHAPLPAGRHCRRLPDGRRQGDRLDQGHGDGRRSAMSLPIQRLTHVGICVSDLERSLRFYRDLLGFSLEHQLEVAGEPTDTLLRLRGTKLRALYLTRDGVRIELLHFASPPAPAARERVMNEHGLTHLSFRVADLDAMLAALRAAGVGVLEETVLRFPEFQSAACFITDPDGQLIELVEAPGDPAAPPRS